MKRELRVLMNNQQRAFLHPSEQKITISNIQPHILIPDTYKRESKVSTASKMFLDAFVTYVTPPPHSVLDMRNNQPHHPGWRL